MMYNQKMAVAIKSANKVLREFDDTVYVPFGSEYSILIKNLNTVRAKVSITIDGTDVLDGTSLIINANDDLELERYIKAGNLKAGNRFKFIERTASIEQHRGVDVSDGLIRIEFQYEVNYGLLSGNSGWGQYGYPKHHTIFSTDAFGGPVYLNSASPNLTRSAKSLSVGDVSNYSATINSVFASSTQPINADVGITVPGSESDQQFKMVSGFVADPTKHVLIFKMMGVADDVVIEKPVTVKHKPKCVTCGHVNKAKAKFCSECGTSLTII